MHGPYSYLEEIILGQLLLPVIILTIFVAFVIIGGLRRISAVAQVVVPFMAAAYIIAAVVILILNYKAIPGAVVEIVQSAFGMRAVAGGALGAMMLAMQKVLPVVFSLTRPVSEVHQSLLLLYRLQNL